MQESKLGLDFGRVEYAKELAKRIAAGVQDFVEQYTTVAVERTLCRLLGIDGVDENTVPLPNVLVNEIKEKELLGQGILFFLGNAMLEFGDSPQQIAEKVARGELDISRLAAHPHAEIEKVLEPYIRESVERIQKRRQKREQYIETLGEGRKPYLYVIVATGNIYEDVVQAQAAARRGRISLRSFVPLARVYWTMSPMALRRKVLGGLLPLRKISGLCGKLWTKSEKRWEGIFDCVIIVPVCVCRRLRQWELWRD